MNKILMKYILSGINKKDFSPDKLVPKGFTYSQIGESLYELINQEYITVINNNFSLTKKGNDFLRKEKPYKEIKKLTEYKCAQIPIDAVYIPNYNKGDFKEIEN